MEITDETTEMSDSDKTIFEKMKILNEQVRQLNKQRSELRRTCQHSLGWMDCNHYLGCPICGRKKYGE